MAGFRPDLNSFKNNFVALNRCPKCWGRKWSFKNAHLREGEPITSNYIECIAKCDICGFTFPTGVFWAKPIR